MSYVSVGQVENLEEAIGNLDMLYQGMESACQAQIACVDARCEVAQAELENSTALLDAGIEQEMQAENAFVQCQQALMAAQGELSNAHAALAFCEAGGRYDAEGHYYLPICSQEEQGIAIAEADVKGAETALFSAEQGVAAAKQQRMALEQRRELAHQCLDMASQLAQSVHSECAARLSQAAQLLETGRCRLGNARAALSAYLNTHPAAAEFHAWLNWKPDGKKVVTPQDLYARLNLTPEQQRYFYQYLAESDPQFRAKVADYRRQLANAAGTAEVMAVQLKVRRHLSGYCGEKIVEKALGPLAGSVSTQSKTRFADGRYTKTDLVLQDLNVPVILGRGAGMSAPKGGSIAIEVKCGGTAYLLGQQDHMIFQSGGHQQANASMTICSRDIKKLPQEKQDQLREALRQSGSPLIGMLPEKAEIDKACWLLVTEEQQNSGGADEN